MTRQLKCLKCKKPIGKDKKAYRCSDCESYPFHEDCLDDQGYCVECAKEKETEEEDEVVNLRIYSDNEWWNFDEFTRKEAEELIDKVGKAIEVGVPAMMDIGEDNHYFVLRNITAMRIFD